MPCAVSCARVIGLATISSSPSPSQAPAEAARLLPAALGEAVGVLGALVAVAVGQVRHRLAVADEVQREVASRADGGLAQEQLVQAGLARDLRVEGDREQVALARRDRMAVDRGEDLDAVAVLGDPRARG